MEDEEMATERVKRTEVFHIEPSKLAVADGFNVRVDYGDLQALAQSILENGIKHPLRGHKKGKVYVITDGHRRFEAYKMVADKMPVDTLIPFLQEPRSYTDEDRTYDLIVANDSHPLSMVEQAEVYKRLHKDFGIKQTDIAKRVGKSKMYISHCLLLLTAPDNLLEAVRKGLVSATTVIEQLQSAVEPEEKEAVAKKVTDAIEKKGGKITKKDIIVTPEEEEVQEAKFTPTPATDFSQEEAKQHKKENPAVKEDATISKMVRLLASLKAQKLPRNKEAFDTLEALVEWTSGKMATETLAAKFFKQQE